MRLDSYFQGAISILAFANDGRFLASAGADRSVLIWDLAHGHLLGIFGEHEERIEALSFSRDGNVLVSGKKTWVLYKRYTYCLHQTDN